MFFIGSSSLFILIADQAQTFLIIIEVKLGSNLSRRSNLSLHEGLPAINHFVRSCWDTNVFHSLKTVHALIQSLSEKVDVTVEREHAHFLVYLKL